MVTTSADERPRLARANLELDWLHGVGDLAARYVTWPLRLMLAVGFIYHGWPKLFDADAHLGFVGMLTSLGVPLPAFMAWVVGIVEVFGGLALLVGALTGLATVLLLIDMGCAALLVHASHGFGATQIVGQGPQGPIFGTPGVELNVLYMAALFALLLAGPGPLSVDGWWARRKTARPR